MASTVVSVVLCSVRQLCHIAEEPAVWKHILTMPDPLQVRYDIIEEMFSMRRREKTKDDTDGEKKPKEPAVVRPFNCFVLV